MATRDYIERAAMRSQRSVVKDLQLFATESSNGKLILTLRPRDWNVKNVIKI